MPKTRIVFCKSLIIVRIPKRTISIKFCYIVFSWWIWTNWPETGGQSLPDLAATGSSEPIVLGSVWFTHFLWTDYWIIYFNILQIWTMLPGFCTCPVDLLSSFKGIARNLGMAINERPDLRLTVCQALRTLINKGCSTGMSCTQRLCTKLHPVFRIFHSNVFLRPRLCIKRRKRQSWAASPRTSCPSSLTSTGSSLQRESRAPTGWRY